VTDIDIDSLSMFLEHIDNAQQLLDEIPVISLWLYSIQFNDCRLIGCIIAY
jgi:hypothetical protein